MEAASKPDSPQLGGVFLLLALAVCLYAYLKMEPHPFFISDKVPHPVTSEKPVPGNADLSKHGRAVNPASIKYGQNKGRITNGAFVKTSLPQHRLPAGEVLFFPANQVLEPEPIPLRMVIFNF